MSFEILGIYLCNYGSALYHVIVYMHKCNISIRQASVAQLVERSAVNRKVVGSIPTGSGFFYLLPFLNRVI